MTTRPSCRAKSRHPARSYVHRVISSASPEMTKVALIQMRCGTELEENFSRAIEFIRDAAGQGAEIVCLPELFRSQYFCQTEDHRNFDLAEEITGRIDSGIGEVARETRIVIIASLFERRSAGLYHNTAAIIDADGKLLGKYRKMHIPDDPLYHEKFYFAPGDLGFQAWQTSAARSVSAFAGTNGTPKRRVSRRYVARRSFFIPRQSAGIRVRKKNLEKRNIRHGKQFSVAMLSPMDVRRCGEPRRPRSACRRGRHRILGPELRVRARRRNHRQRFG